MKNKCAICSATRGKRSCKLRNNGLVCPKCCASFRNPECGGCRYYEFSRTYHAERERERAVKEFVVEIDPRYEPAQINKAMVESVDYYKDYSIKKRSYIKEFIEKIKEV